jgi:ATP-dependent DNA helicase RecG
VTAGRPPTILDEPAFWARFGRVEHESLEFKASANNLREVIPAMAMTCGGVVILGVTDDRRLSGCGLGQRTFDAVMRRGQEVGVDIEVEPVSVAGVDLTVIHVPRVADRIVTTSDGRLLRRVGSDNVPLRGDALGQFVRRRGGLVARVSRRVWLGAR